MVVDLVRFEMPKLHTASGGTAPDPLLPEIVAMLGHITYLLLHCK